MSDIGNPFDAMRQAVEQARAVNRAADRQADALVDLLDGRLRNVEPWRLVMLKRQLRDFDANRKQWKDRA